MIIHMFLYEEHSINEVINEIYSHTFRSIPNHSFIFSHSVKNSSDCNYVDCMLMVIYGKMFQHKSRYHRTFEAVMITNSFT